MRGSRPGKQVQLLETEIRYLCTKAREIFISQPILLELEAPIKVGARHFRNLRGGSGGKSANMLMVRFAVTSTASTTTFSACSNTAGSRPRPTTSSSATTSIAASSLWRPSACCSHTRSSTPRTSSSYAATTSARLSTVSMVSTTSARGDTTLSCGRRLPTASTACQLLPSSTRRSSPCTAVLARILTRWNRFGV